MPDKNLSPISSPQAKPLPSLPNRLTNENAKAKQGLSNTVTTTAKSSHIKAEYSRNAGKNLPLRLRITLPPYLKKKLFLCREGITCMSENKDGAATLEVVIIIAVLMAIALIFNTQLRQFAQNLFHKVFDDQSILSQIGNIGG